MSINVGYDFETNGFIANNKKENLEETKILTKIASDLNLTNYKIENKSNNYSTLCYLNYDIIRLKYTNKSKWISILLTKDDKKKYINNSLFEQQKNKNQLFWKSIINSDIEVYYDFIKNSCNNIKN